MEISRIRSQASAARLEARAAELELMLRRIRDEQVVDPGATNATAEALRRLAAGTTHGESSGMDEQPGQPMPRILVTTPGPATATECETTPAESSASTTPSPATASGKGPSVDSDFGSGSELPAALTRTPNSASGDSTSTQSEPTRHRFSGAIQDATAISEGPPKESVNTGAERRIKAAPRRRSHPIRVSKAPQLARSAGRSGVQQQPKKRRRIDGLPGDRRPDADNCASLSGAQAPKHPSRRQQSKRRKPSAWVLSAVIHAALFLVLGLWTLSIPSPKDQIALAAAVVEPVENVMETISVEAVAPETDAETETEDPVEIDMSATGEIPVRELTAPLGDSVMPPLPNAAFSVSTAAGSPRIQSSPSQLSSEFCGVRGGGSHFVYLVDSSGSMGAAFDAARREVLRAVEQLSAEQRFYVVFFDDEPDYMRISDPTRDEPASVPATPENKRRLASWALAVTMNRGRAPYEPLEFALELKPDAIFLLSDGEFPQRIEGMLEQKNRYSNLFGDTGPISTVHTIGFYSDQGESRMRRIAQNNGGQYRHVPKP